METYDLHVAAKWDIEIATIRERVSDFTNIIGFGNFYYRICKDDEFGTFKIRLWPSEGTSGKFIKLTLRYRDLYVESIAGHRFERYPSTLLDNRRNGASLRSAIYEICDGSDDFETRALVVWSFNVQPCPALVHGFLRRPSVRSHVRRFVGRPRVCNETDSAKHAPRNACGPQCARTQEQILKRHRIFLLLAKYFCYRH